MDISRMKSRQYEDIVIDKPKGHSKDDRLSLKSSYDEVSVNFGKPVIHGSKSESTSDCIFDSVTFQSPIEDLSPASREAVRQGIMPPVPAPRPSKLTQQSNEIYENVEILLQNQELLSKRIPRREEIYEDIDFPHRSPPSPPPRNTILIPEQPHLFNSTIPDDLSGAKPKHNHISKLKTIDIRNAVEQWYEEAEEELERDLSIDLSVLDQERGMSKKNPAPTLLRDFDPVLEEVESVNNSLSSNSLVDIMKDPLKSEIEIIHNESENIYVACPRRIASSESLDLPAPLIPPPPLPELEPPPLPPNKPKTSESSTDILTEEEEVESKLRRLFKSEDKISTTSSSTTSSIDYESALKVSSESASHLPPQRSFSAANLNLTKMASHLKRKMSDRVFMRKSDSWRRSPLIESENSTTTGAKSHSGVLSLWSGNKKAYQPKWCVLGNGNFQYFNDEDSLVIPKELITLSSLLCLNKIKKDSDSDGFYCFDMSYCSLLSGKYSTKTFGARTYHEREVWLERIVQSLNYKLSNHSMTQSTRLGWAYLKIGFAGTWNSTWISLANRSLSYFSLHEGMWEVMDLRKTKNISLKEGAEYLEPPFTSYPVLVIDFVDRSLYIAVNSKIECNNWWLEVQSKAFTNGNTLVDQQMTLEEIPVIVDKCTKHIFSHGCLSEGIYRQSGVKTKIDRLLNEFKRNAWTVQISKNDYSEHDVANTLKRFMRTLEEPLLTEGLRGNWMKNSCTKDIIDKKKGYRALLRKLPVINYNTLRRLISHLSAIASQCDKNLMTNCNLASIWGPTLLTVDGQKANDFARTSGESDVCRDLIEHYSELFDVKPEELKRERLFTEVLTQISTNHDAGQHGHLKRSGDLRIWVYIDTKTSENCVGLVVQPSMKALEMTQRVLQKTQREGVNNLFLHEVVMEGALERPLHHSEVMLDVNLRWGSWSTEDRKNNCLLLKRNTLYEQALPRAIPPLNFYAKAYFGENKARSKFSKHLFSMNNAKVTYYKTGGDSMELGTWPIEDIKWYIGAEEKRKAPFRLNITFIEKDVPVCRTKDHPYFGHTISFEHTEDFISWIAAMLVAEHPNNVSVPASLIVLNNNERKID
ncbi:arf-GAP with Rho-GAP domain, ANK repeat and PH domain-containing protein 2 isoform X2 [Lepeophtheirus salmonis]|uniref:Uncharacterized protein n=1 Tax=Lepeophtheirus salmonis TaxID=72036 RepID=A0A0K2U9E3_LEPSM|nr:arf-GAP with Rho-GAP domain, ANK repeat and PH domain-containing protein 1-like isoform X2 [Lepeophtheirus salmonis]